MKNTTITSNGSTEKWKESLIRFTRNQIGATPDKKKQRTDISKAGIHLAIFNEPFLTLLLNGAKTVESRFSLNKVAPFKKVHTGDIVFIKRTGGEVVGYFTVGKVHYFEKPNLSQLKTLKETFSEALGAYSVNRFWENREHCRYISLIEVLQVESITPFKINKRDRTAWSVLEHTKLQV